ncbi:MAG: preprotein translocase subunit SecA, partial [Candidatus Omnitrophica bacterium]|nr:preprotein translocase subunit SecA [Candidatus Omnitrophota bacterium]
EPEIQKLTDAQMRSKTDIFKERLKAGETLDDILPEAFALVREAARRTINMRHFDVQLAGGIVLHQGKISEMATGEGKTLVATLPVYLNALTGKGVHVVTVNDYLARRDREWMGPIYEFLGLTVGVIQHDMSPYQRQLAYNSDVTYGTNNEYGFDYLRDNMVIRKEDRVQRKLHYAIVDEVDSILIDEARTPLIISGPAEESTDKYYKIDKLVPRLTKGKRDEEKKIETGDYIVDEKAHTAYLTEEGEIKAARLLGIDNLHDIKYMDYKHHINQALRAHELFKRDVDYVIKDGGVMIVDEFTGRLMPGRRWSDGLHQAIEAKESVRIERENQTLATITFQNYFRMYEKLAGMTGTALTEAGEFSHIYKLDVVVIPTNKPLIRTNYPDCIYKTEKEKFEAVVKEIAELYERGRPVLVGTISIDKSERLSLFLKRKGIPHQVLNAKYHEMEAHIVAQAGRFKAVTIATNMAGRGTDILLGGNPEYLANDYLKQKEVDPKAATSQQKQEALNLIKPKIDEEHKNVVSLGGLHILGTERHEARRIDNQLRGRAGRQGDPGSSRFYLSLEDDLLRIFGSERIKLIMDRLGLEEGQEIQHPLVTKAIETAQKRVEEHNFGIRKHLLEYDNVMNKQREILYEERRFVLEAESLKEHIFEMIDDVADEALDIYANEELRQTEWDLDGLINFLNSKFLLPRDIVNKEEININREGLREGIINALKDTYNKKEESVGSGLMRELEKIILLQTIDSKWKDHLYSMDILREGIGLRAYGQKDPLVEYQHEGFDMFEEMTYRIKEEALEYILKVRPFIEEKIQGIFEALPQEFSHPEFSRPTPHQPTYQDSYGEDVTLTQPQPPKVTTYQRTSQKVGRNDPCPCGSGKKYKKCCGK